MACPSIPERDGKDFFQNLVQKSPNQRLPLSGTFEITMRCNMRCIHCYLGNNRFQPKNGELTTTEIFRIIDEITDAGCLWLLVSGGEPLLRPDLFDVLGYARKKGIILRLFSNGTLFNEENVQKLANCPPEGIEITVYGYTQKTYESVTGIPGSYAKLMAGLDLLNQYNLPFSLKSVLMKANLHEFSEIRDFCIRRGGSFHYDEKLCKTIDGQSYPANQRISTREAVALDSLDSFRMEEFRAILEKKSHLDAGKEKVFRCGAGMQTFHIDSHGRMSMCMLTRNFQFNLRNGSFKEGWENEFLKARNVESSRKTPCSTCTIRQLCQQCPGYAYLENQDYEKKVEFLCELSHLRAESQNEPTGVNDLWTKSRRMT